MTIKLTKCVIIDIIIIPKIVPNPHAAGSTRLPLSFDGSDPNNNNNNKKDIVVINNWKTFESHTNDTITFFMP